MKRRPRRCCARPSSAAKRTARSCSASLLVEQEREEEAEELLRAAVERGSVAAMIDLANLLSEYEEGDEEAEQLYRTALEHGDLDAENNLGVLLRDLGRTDEARELLKRAADRGDELAAENLAKLDEERLEQPAEDAFERLLARGVGAVVRGEDGDRDPLLAAHEQRDLVVDGARARAPAALEVHAASRAASSRPMPQRWRGTIVRSRRRP